MNLGLSGPILDRDEVVVKGRTDAVHICEELYFAKELSELRDTDGGILKCWMSWIDVRC